jgi:hypothetical protein
MIKITVSEGYAFDYLAILEVKTGKSPSPQNTRNFADCLADLRAQLNPERLAQILASPEYADLVQTNRKVFEAVDGAKRDEVPASRVDALNYQRFECKQRLQNKFFHEPLTEQKIGY